MSIQKNLNDHLSGQKVIAVEFIFDYLRISFEDYFLTLYNWPIIFQLSLRYEKNDINYRNFLCELIGRTVISANDSESSCIQIYFEKNLSIKISLKDEDREAPDIALLFDKEQYIMIW